MKAYLLSVVAAALLCVVSLALVEGQTMQRAVRFVGGLLLLFVVVKPLLSVDLAAWIEVQTAGDGVFDMEIAQKTYDERLREHIIQTTETYIEETAAALGATVQARVTLSETEPPVPQGVTIIGTLQPEQKDALHRYLTDALGITQEEWKLYE